MNSKFIYIFCFFFFVPKTYLFGQGKWQNLQVNKIPFQKSVNCLAKDSAGFLWLGTPEGLYRYDGFEFSLINTFLSDGLRLSDPQVNNLMLDSLQNLWIATENGVTILNPVRNQYIHFAVSDFNAKGGRNSIQFIVQNKEYVWLGGNQGILYRIPMSDMERAFKENGQLKFEETSIPHNLPIYHMMAAEDGGIWINDRQILLKIDSNLQHQKKINIPISISHFHFTEDEQAFYAPSINGILIFDVKTESFNYLYEFSLPLHIKESYRERKIHTDANGGWWIYGLGGIFGKFDPEVGSYIDYSPAFAELKLNKYGSFQALLQDKPDHLWIGRSDGLYEVALRESIFQKLILPNKTENVDAFISRSIYALKDSSLLIGGYSDMYRYFPKKNIYVPIDFYIPEENLRVNPFAYDFFEQGDTVYIASETFGLLFFDPSTNKISALMTRAEYEALGAERRIIQWSTAVIRDRNNVVWLGTYEGLMYTNLKDSIAAFRVQGQKALSRSFIYDIQEDKDQSIWLATSNGLYTIPPDRKSLQGHSVSEFANISIKALWLNPDGTLWLATSGEGLKHYNPKSKEIQNYTIREGLPDNVVVSIFPDKKGNFWLGTNHGLCYFNPNEKSFLNFFHDDGLPGNSFQHNAIGQDLKGITYVGLPNGIISIKDFRDSKQISSPIPVISKIIKHLGAENKTQSTIYSSFNLQKIHLDYRDSYFSVFFSVKDFTGQKPQFSYLLEGVNSTWNFLDEKNSLQFAALQPGNYTLHIRARTNKSGWSSPLVIPIVVDRAYYATWWAYLLYLSAFILVAYVGLRLYWNRKILEKRLQMEHTHLTQVEELAEAKNRFFTNITHELRTPLTLIKGPIDIIWQKTTDVHLKILAKQANRQADSMLHLVDQMLEISRIDSKTEKLQVIHSDVVSLLQTVFETYRAVALRQNIEFTFFTDQSSFTMDFDPDKLQKILFNLLSNAFKFTPIGNTIKLSLKTNNSNDTKHITITLADSGIGISPEALPFIFDRFYQADSSITRAYGGTGIGLSYVKELVALHGGTITAESKTGVGTSFQIRLPLVQAEVIQSNEKINFTPIIPYIDTSKILDIKSAEDNSHQHTHSSLPLILLIEDHHELANFIIKCLQEHYQVKHVEDGLEGYVQAIDQVPDLIITDLMLPKMDGLTLAGNLKSNELSSHIPLIMLTARSTDQDKIHGLRGGVDAYITKPFSVEELMLTIKNLLRLHNNIVAKSTLSTHEEAVPEEAKAPKEDLFYQRLIQIIEINISDENFGVNELLKEVGVSRTQLHRKLKATTGKSANELIRNCKLQKALVLLKTKDYSIAEIAQAVGYGSPSYFSKVFGEHFGYLPSSVREQISKEIKKI